MLDELKNIIAINKNLEEIYKSEEFSQFLAKLIEYKLSEKQTDNEEYVNIVYAAKQFDLNLEDIVEKYLKDLTYIN